MQSFFYIEKPISLNTRAVYLLVNSHPPNTAAESIKRKYQLMD